MVSISEIVRQVEPSFGRMGQKMIERFKIELLDVFKNEAAGKIKEILLKVYDDLSDIEEGQMGPRVRGKDPLSLRNLRSVFESQITRELKSNIRIEGDQLVIQVMDKSKLGFSKSSPPEKGSPQTVDILGFYIEGIAGEFAFITKEHHAARGRTSSGGLGRVGAGFLISRDRYKRERWAEVTGIPFEDVRHSISGQPPFNGFRTALQGLDFSPFINKALENTTKFFQGRAVK